MRIPCPEQKKPCRHRGQSSLDDASAAKAGAGTGFLGLAGAFVNTGFSVVCLPVLHLHNRGLLSESSTQRCKEQSKIKSQPI